MRAPITDAPADSCGCAGPKSGVHPGVAIFAREPFELAAADVFEILARGIRRRVLVEVHRHGEALRDRRGDVLRQRHAVVHRRALDRHERDDVDGAEPRMLAADGSAGRCASTATSKSARVAAFSDGASPTSVKTERLCDASDE